MSICNSNENKIQGGCSNCCLSLSNLFPSGSFLTLVSRGKTFSLQKMKILHQRRSLTYVECCLIFAEIFNRITLLNASYDQFNTQIQEEVIITLDRQFQKGNCERVICLLRKIRKMLNGFIIRSYLDKILIKILKIVFSSVSYWRQRVVKSD